MALEVTLGQVAVNKSTYPIAVGFLDANGDVVTPSSATWTLTDEFGNIVNERDEVVIDLSSYSVENNIIIVLSGADIDQEISSSRILTVEAIYNSLVYGNDLPTRQQAIFTIGEWISKE